MPRIPRFAAAAFAAAVVVSAARSQCGFQWLPGPAANGPDGSVSALLRLPNGDLIAGGAFRVADGVIANGVARWDGATWHPLGSGIAPLASGPGTVFALARLPNGDLIAGGSFLQAGGVAAANIARWNGSAWQPLGTGLDGAVRALQVLPNGDLAAGGSFQNAGGTYVRGLARWDGISWHAFDTSLQVFEATALALLPNGDLVAGIESIHGFGAVRWTGTTWQQLPGLDTTGLSSVRELAVLPSGLLALIGTLRIGGVARRLAVFDGTSMTPNDPPRVPVALLATGNGDLVVAGNVGGVSSVFRYDGTTWQPQPGEPQTVQVLIEDAAGRVVAGGRASDDAGLGAVTRETPQGWTTLGAGVPPKVGAAVRMPNGDLVVGGVFDTFGGVAARNLARWNGSAWAPVGGGVNARVRCLSASPAGDLVVGGDFTEAGGAPANFVARWNGQTWSTLGAGLPASPAEIGAGAGGQVLAFVPGGAPGVMEFQGATWAPATLGFTSPLVRRIVALPTGGFALAGVFLGTQGQTGALLYDNGVATSLPLPLGANPFGMDALVDRNGDLVVTSSSVNRWDGTAWTQVSPARPLRFAELPDGTFVGMATGLATVSSLQRLTATGEEALGEVRGTVDVIAASGSGDLVVGGGVESVGNQVSAGFAQARPSCASAVTTFGAGCVGSAGPVTLAAANTPWTGASFTMVANGMAANSLAVQLVGVQPLSVPLPGGAPGCSVFVDPIFAEAFVPSGGAVTTTWLVPDTAAAVGLTVRAQVVGVELSAVGIDRLTSSNALRAVIGSL